nr:amidase [Alicyclobacillus acidiphilus]
MSTADDKLGLLGLRSAMMTGELSATTVVDACLSHIQTENPGLGAYLHVCEERARRAAATVDAVRQQQPQLLGELAGAPLSIKDLLDTSYAPTTYGNGHFRNNVPTTTATVIERLEREHAIVLGKTNLHEFAFGVTNENPHFGPARNPRDPERITGGSSGGSAASVAAGLAVASIGTDTGGSVRIPASLTGVVGYKPSFGLVPTTGVYPLAPSLDHVGPLTTSVFDAALLTDIMAAIGGHRLSRSVARAKSAPGSSIRAGIPNSLIQTYARADVALWFIDLIGKMSHDGVIRNSANVELDGEVIARHQGNIISAEAYAVHADQLDSNPDVYGKDIRERLSAGRLISAKDYIGSKAFQTSFASQLETWFERVDCILMPTTPITAPRIGTAEIVFPSGPVPVRQLLTRFTNPWNLSGLPAITLPAGTIEGMPIGLQIIGPRDGDEHLLRVAAWIESYLPYRVGD